MFDALFGTFYHIIDPGRARNASVAFIGHRNLLLIKNFNLSFGIDNKFGTTCPFLDGSGRTGKTAATLARLRGRRTKLIFNS